MRVFFYSNTEIQRIIQLAKNKPLVTNKFSKIGGCGGTRKTVESIFKTEKGSTSS